MHLPPQLSKIPEPQVGRLTRLETMVELRVVVLRGQRDHSTVLGLLLKVLIRPLIVLQFFVNFYQI
jgi:hypothetical protein